MDEHKRNDVNKKKDKKSKRNKDNKNKNMNKIKRYNSEEFLNIISNPSSIEFVTLLSYHLDRLQFDYFNNTDNFNNSQI